MPLPIPCKLCGLPVRLSKGESVDESKDYFCCKGCKMVYAMLMESDQWDTGTDFKSTELYQRCVAARVIPSSEADIPQASETSSVDTHTLKPEGVKINPLIDTDNRLSCAFTVTGMWCPACAWIIEDALSRKNGVDKAVCNFSSDRAKAYYDPVKTSPIAILKTVQDLGYGASPLTASKQKNLKEFIRLCTAAFLTMNVMMLSWAVYSGFFLELSNLSVQLLAWPAAIMATVVLLYCGLPIHKRAFAGIQAGRPGMETLISTGSFTAYNYSLINLFAGSLHLYFDTASMLILLVLIGKMLERRARDRISEDLSDFFSLVPEKVKLVTEKFPKGRYVSAQQLAEGDLFQAEAGEILAGDGRVVSGSALLDQSSITGEAKPKSVSPGDSITSGSRVISGRIQVKALHVGSASILGKMLTVMEGSLIGKTGRTERFESLLKFFVPSVMGIAILTALGWMITGLSSYEAMSRGICVMVISCPCALGLAIPLALTAGISQAGKIGILVRDTEAFEAAAGIDTIVFDKTGTLTAGAMELLGIETWNGYTKEQALAIAVALESDSNHYIAHALRSHGRKTGVLPLDVRKITNQSNGISGKLNKKLLRLGSREFTGIDELSSPQKNQAKPGEAQAVTEVYLSIDGSRSALFSLGDSLRPDTKMLIFQLRDQGYSLFIVSGDSTGPVRSVASLLEIARENTRAGLLPHEKARVINTLKQNGKTVAMVGDGINDAPAMAESNLAVAVRSGLEPGKTVAAITLMQENPAQLLDFLNLATRVNRKVKQNLGFALIYNIISIPVAAAGLLNPIVAASAMLLSSLSVTLNTLTLVKQTRLLNKKER